MLFGLNRRLGCTPPPPVFPFILSFRLREKQQSRDQESCFRAYLRRVSGEGENGKMDGLTSARAASSDFMIFSPESAGKYIRVCSVAEVCILTFDGEGGNCKLINLRLDFHTFTFVEFYDWTNVY
jgi:hypothetical protein